MDFFSPEDFGDEVIPVTTDRGQEVLPVRTPLLLPMQTRYSFCFLFSPALTHYLYNNP